MEQAVIVAALRTAVGKFQGSLAGIPAHELGATVIRQLLADTGITPESVDEVIMGQVLTAGCGQNPARQAGMAAGLPSSVPAFTVGKVCGHEGMIKTFTHGAQFARVGWWSKRGLSSPRPYAGVS